MSDVLAKMAMSVDQVLRKAKTLAMQRKVGEAAELYRMVLQAEPLNAAALAGMKALGGQVGSQGNGSASIEPSQDKLQVIISLHGAGKFAEGVRRRCGNRRVARFGPFPSSAWAL